MKTAAEETKAFRFTLFVVGDEPNSVLARQNLLNICDEHLRAGTCTVRVVDILVDYQVALDHNVLVTPMLIVEGPRGRSTILGNLSDIDRILVTLGCNT
jgi:hypothetical protein